MTDTLPIKRWTRVQYDQFIEKGVFGPEDRIELLGGTLVVREHAQDRAVQESMGPIVDRAREHLGPADRAAIQARRLLLQATRTVEAGGIPPGVEPTYYTLHPAEAVVPRATDWRTLLAPAAPRPQLLQQV